MESKQVFEAYSPRNDGVDQRSVFCGVCGARTEARQVDGHQRAVCPRCGFVDFRNPVASVSVLVVGEDDRFLLCRRAVDAVDGGKWCLPCGFVEYDEDFLTAARREVEEESGLRVEIVSLISAASMFHTPERHDLTTVLLAQVSGGELRPGDDVDDARWYRFGEALPELAFEADEHIIRRYGESRFEGLPVDPRYAR